MKKKSKKSIGKTFTSIISRVDPLEKNINKDDISDTGIESIRLANSGVKTVNRTIKTASTTIHRTKTAIYKTAKVSARIVKVTIKVAENVAVHTVASLMNPIVIAVLGFLIVIVMTFALVFMFLGGGASAVRTRQEAYSNAVGLGDVPEQYAIGLEMLHNAIKKRQEEFYIMVDSLYYDEYHLTYTDLVDKYAYGFASQSNKDIIKNVWNFKLTDEEAMAIAYVYLEKQQNKDKDSERGIYEVLFIPEVFELLLEKSVTFKDDMITNQRCPGGNCTKKVEYIDNPEYKTALDKYNLSVELYNTWADIARRMYENSAISDADERYWDYKNYVEPRINNWTVTYNRYPDLYDNGYYFIGVLGRECDNCAEILKNTPAYIEKVTYICENQHELHTISLESFTKDEVMDALGFDEIDKEWVKLTEEGYKEMLEEAKETTE